MALGGVCEVCKKNTSKYKCPVCLIKFCCVACFKKHKESDTCVKPEPVVEQKPFEEQPYEFETEDTVKTEKLNLLRSDSDVRKDLENPHLRRMLEELNSSRNADMSIEKAMKEPLFSEFVTHCLQVVDEEK
ncbi:unnamed protein product [Larinioides sclopetarius]|uniref:Zinc finger HIT domain-containing protein 3 n=1 Tax=Larinioides sclopetarius TaxID=280406 RepID=A0AAV2BQ71_9ARAC